ncbi:Protein of unknown function [Pyronema omphalodes CBS 100304]|uniref:Uncharacterized protein n=1 Tax=Pyronema omphalodes (strain CBS 100304) TaxID=1076935 RepID=U4LDW2_PYROM|nr:Protein of unknown function [Pyronema omphalodes CBS 100304]
MVRRGRSQFKLTVPQPSNPGSNPNSQAMTRPPPQPDRKLRSSTREVIPTISDPKESKEPAKLALETAVEAAHVQEAGITGPVPKVPTTGIQKTKTKTTRTDNTKKRNREEAAERVSKTPTSRAGEGEASGLETQGAPKRPKKNPKQAPDAVSPIPKSRKKIVSAPEPESENPQIEPNPEASTSEDREDPQSVTLRKSQRIPKPTKKLIESPPPKPWEKEKNIGERVQ